MGHDPWWRAIWSASEIAFCNVWLENTSLARSYIVQAMPCFRLRISWCQGKCDSTSDFEPHHSSFLLVVFLPEPRALEATHWSKTGRHSLAPELQRIASSKEGTWASVAGGRHATSWWERWSSWKGEHVTGDEMMSQSKTLSHSSGKNEKFRFPLRQSKPLILEWNWNFSNRCSVYFNMSFQSPLLFLREQNGKTWAKLFFVRYQGLFEFGDGTWSKFSPHTFSDLWQLQIPDRTAIKDVGNDLFVDYFKLVSVRVTRGKACVGLGAVLARYACTMPIKEEGCK